MRELTEFETYVIEQKGTERPFSGEYDKHDANGIYHCKRCDAPLYCSSHKFNAHCGWPAFDNEIEGAVKRNVDADGRRVEIVCACCDGHLGHVFEGERLTENNIRHCVNSVSMLFKPVTSENKSSIEIEYATLGAGCFWCIEAIFRELKGVQNVVSGYVGGTESEASYKQVCSGTTGHAEVIHLEFDPDIISFENLLEVFFKSHDPTTLNQQGNDVGPQYRSVIFTHNAAQIASANDVIERLTKASAFDRPIVTEVSAFDCFYEAEHYHHNYFEHHGHEPYCQMVVRPKLEKFRAAFRNKLK